MPVSRSNYLRLDFQFEPDDLIVKFYDVSCLKLGINWADEH